MRIAITGSSGLIGTALVRDLEAAGHAVTRVVRDRQRAAADPSAVYWDPERGEVDVARLEGLDVVIHLAGESIYGVWTAGKRARLRESRVRGTMLLAETLASLGRPPRVLLSASGVNYYGARDPAEPVDEGAAPGTGFLAETAVAWEAATRPAEDAGIRVAHLRSGVVLSARGGALAAMLPIFRFGLGARLGSGEQMMSWIARDDVVRVVRHLLAGGAPAGPFNVVAPEPVSNAEFTRTLGRILHRPAIFTVPAFLLRLAPGRMADEILLAGARVVPRRLLESGFRFAHPTLGSALRHALAE